MLTRLGYVYKMLSDRVGNLEFLIRVRPSVPNVADVLNILGITAGNFEMLFQRLNRHTSLQIRLYVLE